MRVKVGIFGKSGETCVGFFEAVTVQRLRDESSMCRVDHSVCIALGFPAEI